MYTVQVIFGGFSDPPAKEFDNLTDLALYLERIPSMPQFDGFVDIRVEPVLASVNQTLLPFQA